MCLVKGWGRATESDLKVRNVKRHIALAMVAGASLLMAACSDVSGTNAATHVLTVVSSNPSSGVSIGVTSAGNNNTVYGTTSFSLTYDSGASFTLTAPVRTGSSIFSSWSGCASATTVTW
jgi:hypothetical protein